ncbi:hypothetical protein NEIFLAOT_00833 [Neisseria flavescens NRL30031/H210]|uniref:Uncharacterized protein n=1 Tax=Neisseria flavescens NRL30031/H210 TaxID=546264 RepID=C0ELM8_NEIFL|nr:hypothetical protein NEIFLAOT_00833 [Neisseria flavescens NRL30031/H210]
MPPLPSFRLPYGNMKQPGFCPFRHVLPAASALRARCTEKNTSQNKQ